MLFFLEDSIIFLFCEAVFDKFILSIFKSGDLSSSSSSLFCDEGLDDLDFGSRFFKDCNQDLSIFGVNFWLFGEKRDGCICPWVKCGSKLEDKVFWFTFETGYWCNCYPKIKSKLVLNLKISSSNWISSSWVFSFLGYSPSFSASAYSSCFFFFFLFFFDFLLEFSIKLLSCWLTLAATALSLWCCLQVVFWHLTYFMGCWQSIQTVYFIA